MISGTAGSTSFFLKKSCLETKRFSRHAWQVNDVVRPKTVEGRKDLQNSSKHSRTPITRVTMRPVSGLAILSLIPSLQRKLTDDYAVGNTDAHKSPVNERYGLVTSIIGFSVLPEEKTWSLGQTHAFEQIDVARIGVKRLKINFGLQIFHAPRPPGIALFQPFEHMVAVPHQSVKTRQLVG
jgi:hypothetical protein